MPCILLQYILQNLPELKPTHTSLPTPTTYSICPPLKALPPLVSSLVCLPLLLLPTHPTLALTGSDLATSGRRLPGSKLRQALYGGSPTVAQCLLLQTCKLPKTARTAQNCAKTWSVCKPAKERSLLLLHNLPYARACPLCPYKATSTQPPRLPIHLSCHPIPPIPPHLQRKSVMFQVNRVSALWEIFYRGTNRVIVCHMLDIALHRVSCPS